MYLIRFTFLLFFIFYINYTGFNCLNICKTDCKIKHPFKYQRTSSLDDFDLVRLVVTVTSSVDVIIWGVDEITVDVACSVDVDESSVIRPYVHFSSSSPAEQSWWPSHTKSKLIQCRSLQMNSPSEHDLSFSLSFK